MKETVRGRLEEIEKKQKGYSKEFRKSLEHEILPFLILLGTKERDVIRNIILACEKEVFLEELATRLKEYNIEVDLKTIIKKCEYQNKTTPKSKDNKLTEMSSFVTPDYLIEQIYVDRESKFAIYNRNNGEIKYKKTFESFKPTVGEEIQKGAILLPTKATDYLSDESLDEEIKLFIRKWLDVPDVYLEFALLNIKKSWLFDKFYNLNYLRALGDTGSGKSRFLKTLGFLHYKPINVSGALTSAVVFRLINKWGGTLIIDEADFKKSDASEDIIKIINQGYEKGNFVARCNMEDKNKVEFFDVYCPKILATRRTFYDKAVEARCMTQVMIETRRKDIRPQLNDSFFEECMKLRNKLLMYRFKNYDLIDLNISDKIDLSFLEPRLRQVNEGYLSLFQHSKESLEAFIKFLKKYQEDMIAERMDSIEGTVIEGLYKLVFDEETKEIDLNKKITAKDILEANKSEFDDRTTARRVGSILKNLGFDKGNVGRIGQKTGRIIPLNKELLLLLFQRYGCYCVTDVTIL